VTIKISPDTDKNKHVNKTQLSFIDSSPEKNLAHIAIIVTN